jgi:hypothetical protein
MMMAFNKAIHKLGILELPLSGQQYTWSSMQQNPLLERLDWFFISQVWSPEQLNELLVKMQALSFFMQMQPLDTCRI